MKRFSPFFIAVAAVLGFLAAAGLSSCHHIDNRRLPVSYVNISFLSVGEWDLFGVTGAGQYRRFILQERIPAGFPYTAMSATGLGGVLLCTTYLGVPVAYDLACPVECRASVRVFVNEDNEAECPVCHSRYDIFEKLGYPVGGVAAREGFGLEVYNVHAGSQGEYMVVTR